MKAKQEIGQMDPALAVFVKLLRAAETVSVHTHRHLGAVGLTISQFGVLEALLHCGPLCQRDLGRKILKSSGNITTVIHNLERRGLVARERAGTDRRYVSVGLTEAGETLIRRIFPRQAAAIKEELAILTTEEQGELGRLCRKLGLRQLE